MSLISVVVNCDTRPERNGDEGLSKGVVSPDFMDEGIYNKIKFFDGFEIEVIVYVDEHLPISDEQLIYLRKICDKIVISKHRDFPAFNDCNYQNALFLARGEIVVHFDQDTAAFTSSKQAVQELIDMLDQWKFVSYPSHWSPDPVQDDSFNYKWASTRFFMCKRETLDFSEIRKCQENLEYYAEKYKPSRLPHWTEHILGNMVNSSVYYPPVFYDKLSIFTWETYEKWTLRRLNHLPYEDIKNWITSKGGIFYPNNLHA